MVEYTGWKPALTAALSKVGETIAVEQITLTAPMAYTLPAGTPSGVVHSVVFTQNNVGGHTVTHDGQPVTVDLTSRPFRPPMGRTPSTLRAWHCVKRLSPDASHRRSHRSRSASSICAPS